MNGFCLSPRARLWCAWGAGIATHGIVLSAVAGWWDVLFVWAIALVACVAAIVCSLDTDRDRS